MPLTFSPYSRRPVRFLRLWTEHDWRFKVYGIAYERPLPRDELIEAAVRTVSQHLREKPTRQTHYGVGFIGVHDGRGENQVFLDQWVNENELLHTYWVSPPAKPAELVVPATDHNSVCVWDLALQSYERTTWLDTVLANPRGADFEAYLARRMNADV